MSASKPYAHAQYGKLVPVVVLVLRSKGPYYILTKNQPKNENLSILKSNEWCPMTGHKNNVPFLTCVYQFLNSLPVSVIHPSSLMT